jgi:hypothetical protein
VHSKLGLSAFDCKVCEIATFVGAILNQHLGMFNSDLLGTYALRQL